MISGRFEFSLGAVDLCAPAAIEPRAELPADFHTVVGGSDDKFRDAFTRFCLYLAYQHIEDEGGKEDDLVVVGTELGNLAAILRFLRQGVSGDPEISAQQFPHATGSSASTCVNIAKRIRGGNATLNAGTFTPAIVLLHALLHLQARGAGTCHVFVGDTYCDEGLEDVHKTRPAARATPGVCYAALVSGSDFEADIAFGDDASGPANVSAEVGDQARDEEYNNAFHFHRLVSSAQLLAPGIATTLAFRADGRRATVRIQRRVAG
jgi:hypothetical protein